MWRTRGVTSMNKLNITTIFTVFGGERVAAPLPRPLPLNQGIVSMYTFRALILLKKVSSSDSS